MNEENKARYVRIVNYLLLALMTGATLAYIHLRMLDSRRALVTDKGTVAEGQAVAGIQIGGPFTLTDQNGNRVTEKSYTGQYKLVYFGFTMCPMICPTGLQKIAKALEKVGPEAEKIQPILITVDPERDTPDVLRQYVNQFHPRLVGLTGPKADIDNVVKSYRVFAAKSEDDKMSDYSMDHSAFTYLMSPDGKLIALYRDSDTAEHMAEDIKKKIESGV